MKTPRLVVAFAVGFILACGLGATQPPPTDFAKLNREAEELSAKVKQDAKRDAEAEAAHSGRYQIVIGPLTGKQQYLLDTATGQTWHLVDMTDDKGKVVELAWREMRRYGPTRSKDD